MPTMAQLVDRVPEHEREHVRELAENVLFMRNKLKETRAGIARQQVVMPYDNGGGQTGIRENPAFKGYESLLKSYMTALRELREIINRYGETSTTDESPLMRILAEAKAS